MTRVRSAVSNIVPLRRRDGSSPSVQPPLFDQAAVNMNPDGPEPVILSGKTAAEIADLLLAVRGKVPSPVRVDHYVAVLRGEA